MSTTDKWEKLYAALSKIHTDYGVGIVSEPKKVKNFLSDFAPDVPNEVKVFSNVICEQDINRYISSGSEIQMEYLVSRIEDNMGLSTEWAKKIAVGIFTLIGRPVTVSVPTSSEKKNNKTQQTTKTALQTTNNPPKSKPQKTQSYEQQLISSGYSRLSSGLWDKAMENFDSALRTSTYPRAYVGKMMTTLHIKKEKEIPFYDGEFESDPNWIMAMNNATGSYKDRLQRYEREHRSHLSRLKLSKSNKPIQSTTTTKQVVQPQKQSVQPQKQSSTPNKNDPSTFEMVMNIIGLILLLVTIIFGFYAWFANTGLSLLMYYLIMVGSSCVGALLLTVAYGFKDKLESLAFYGIGVPVVVTIISLIVDLVI